MPRGPRGEKRAIMSVRDDFIHDGATLVRDHRLGGSVGRPSSSGDRAAWTSRVSGSHPA
jgi:hypothetical protein